MRSERGGGAGSGGCAQQPGRGSRGGSQLLLGPPGPRWACQAFGIMLRPASRRAQEGLRGSPRLGERRGGDGARGAPCVGSPLPAPAGALGPSARRLQALSLRPSHQRPLTSVILRFHPRAAKLPGNARVPVLPATPSRQRGRRPSPEMSRRGISKAQWPRAAVQPPRWDCLPLPSPRVALGARELGRGRGSGAPRGTQATHL